MASPCSFSKKNFPIMPLDQNPHQPLVFGASDFQSMRAGFLYPKCDNFACLYTHQDQNELQLKRWFFYHDRQSNVAIFPSVVQVYTQPYSFGGRIKLIICQIRPDISVTIHEISTSWKKKRWMAEPIVVDVVTIRKRQYHRILHFSILQNKTGWLTWT